MTPYQRAIQLLGKGEVDKTLMELIRQNTPVVVHESLEYYREYIESFRFVSGQFYKAKYNHKYTDSDINRNMTVSDMFKCRIKDVVAVKFAIMYLMKTQYKISEWHISKTFKCNHASVFHAIEMFQDRLYIRNELSIRRGRNYWNS